jgi:hypothetical protein
MSPRIVTGPGSPTFRAALGVVGAVYLAAIFLVSAGSSVPRETLPRPALYFTQIACLFPKAATHVIEYRIAAHACDEHRDRELDTRVYFPMRPDDKENRFHRLGHFHRSDSRVMRALDEHLVDKHNARVRDGVSSRDGIEGPIGGIALLSLRIPLPSPGDEVPRYEPAAYLDVPPDWRRFWYRSRKADIDARCAEAAR